MPDSAPAAARYRYRVYDLIVESEVRLTSVETCDDDRAPVSIGLSCRPAAYFEQRAPGLREDSDEWIRHTILADGSAYLRVNDVFEAIISADGRSVVCARLGTVDDRTFEANLANFALSASLTLQGEECLHATVVAFGGRAVGLLGSSGAGKSTLAAFLLGRGAELVTDDMLRLRFSDRSVDAYPGPYRLKLFDEAATRFLPDAAGDGEFNALSGKVMVRPGGMPVVPRLPRPLSCLLWLGEEPSSSADNDVTVRTLLGVEKARVLIASAMDIRYFAPDRLVRQLKFAERVGRALPLHALVYPRRFSAFERVVEQIRRLVEAGRVGP
jgi:hypothetical protein